MAKFVDVPPEAIESPLRQLGFSRIEQCGQVVYAKRHDCCPHVLVKVYTSIPIGGSAVRTAGRDSIRVTAAYESSRKSFGIGKFPYIARVSSTEAVVAKMLRTVRDAWERGQEWFAELSARKVMDA